MKTVTERTSRGALFRWMAWFAMANAFLLGIAGLRYFSGFTPGETLISNLYLLLVFPAHQVMLAFLPLFLLVGPWVSAWPSRRWTTRLAILVYAMLIALIVLDSLLWSQSRFHINLLTLKILGWQSWVFVSAIFLIGLFFESMLAVWVWRWVDARRKRHGLWVGLACICAVLFSQLMHAWADATYYVPVTSVGMQLPVYKGFTAKGLFTKLGVVDPAASRERAIARRLARQLDGQGSGQVLNYPLHPLHCRKGVSLNLLLIVADAMRSDMVQRATAPFLWQYARKDASWFLQHFSGGNSSRMGMFSLFYGLPPGYWSSFESLQRSPVLIDELQRQDYQLGLFSSSSLYRPVALDRTAFANVPDLRLGTEPASAPAWQRDRTVTQAWREWLRQQDRSRPFFGFLFYDASNAQDYPPEFETAADSPPASGSELDRRMANYRKSVRFVDTQIEAVVDDLEAEGLLDRTVVVITADHGEEFDEGGLGLRKHGSAYTRYQLQVPMIVHWPGKPARLFEHRTSHFDVVPTLMEDLLGCGNPPGDYASGRNLYRSRGWDWLLAGSYYNYAVLEPDQVTVTYPDGRFEVRDWDYRIVRQPHIRGAVLEAASNENSRFYQR